MKRDPPFRYGLTLTLLTVIGGVCLPVLCVPAYGAERVMLRNGFEFDCARREVVGDRVRLYLLPPAGAGAAGQKTADAVRQNSNYIEVAASAVLRAETIPDPVVSSTAATPAFISPASVSPSIVATPTASPAAATPATAEAGRTAESVLAPGEMVEMLTQAGALHDIDADLLASVVEAESGGNVRAVSRAGAEGLMQLMPGTASDLGVRDPFAPDENIDGGTAYLDALLTRYHNNIKLAVAAYNAGPAAVDRYRGIPPYAETRAYVARVIREFNRRKRAAQVSYRSETPSGAKAPLTSRP